MTKKHAPAPPDTRTDAEQLAAALAEAVAIYDTSWDWGLSVLERKQAREMALYVAVSRWPQWFLPHINIIGDHENKFIEHRQPLARSLADIECLVILAGLHRRCADEVMRQWQACGWSPAELRHVARRRCDEVLEQQRLARR